MSSRSNALYSGKAKTLYPAESQDHFIMEFRNDASAFNGVKLGSFENKGKINNAFNAFIMTYLSEAGILTHFEKMLSDTTSLVKKLEMLPIECVIRNVAAGGLCKRLAIPEGEILVPPLFEFYYKSDTLGDPAINASHIMTFGWATPEEVTELETLSKKINQLLLPLFDNVGFILVDFKLEFGRYHGQLCLGDEFTLDGSRVWDKKTRKKFDKDRFRQDLGDFIESYEEAAHRLGVTIA